MKLKIVILIVMVCVSNLFSAPTYSQLAKVSLEMKNSSLEQVMEEIEKQSEFYFIFNQKQIDIGREVDIRAKDALITDILPELFAGTDISYMILDRKILLTTEAMERSLSKMEKSSGGRSYQPVMEVQQRHISGKVIDESGAALIGVSVSVVGTSVGVLTDIDGNYSVNIPQGATAVSFSFVGMQTETIQLGTQTVINVTLKEAAIGLDEVVVTALGISREKKSLTYAVTEVGGESVARAKELNLGNALSGRIAGVNASGSATGPSGSTRVIIRGNGSLIGDNQPLYVINGVPMIVQNLGSAGTYGGTDAGDGLSSINPDDIESISVLKGGTAAALYGSRAANGVILITTKSGQTKQGIGVEYNGSFTFENPLAIPHWQYEYGSGSGGHAPTSKAEAVSYGRNSWGSRLDGSMVFNPDGAERPYIAQKNNIKNFYDTGTTFSNTIAISGGNETARFRFSASNTDVKAIVPNSGANRKTFNLSANANLSEKIIFEGKAQYNIELNKNRTAIADFTGNPNAAIGVMATNIDVRTLAPGYDKRGYETAWCEYNFVANPYFAAEKRKNEDEWKRFLGSFSLRYNVTDFLYARARLGVDYTNIEGFDITPTGTLHSPLGSMSENARGQQETNAEVLIGFDKKFGDFSVNVIAGANRMYRNSIRSTFSSGDLNVPFVYFITNGKTPNFTRTFSESSINSLFTSADIGFKNYLYLTLSGRQDWFSTLDIKSNSLFYPSVGLSYLISETWKTRPDWLSFAKARASWAQVGGGAPNPYAIALNYTAPTSSHLGQPLMSISGNTIPSLLKPYTSTTMEAGLDFKIFNNRIGIDLTVYDRTTTDDIVNASVAISSSWNSVALNVGEVKNRGIELMLTGTPVSTKTGFNWDVIFNMAYNKNTVVKIADDLTTLSIATARTNNGYVYHFEGQPFGMVSGYEMLRNAEGQIVYNKANGIPMMSAFKALGRGVPPLNISLTNELSYKNFALSFFLDSKFGGVMYSATNAYGTYYGLHKNTVANGARENGVKVNGVDQDGQPYSSVIDAETYFKGVAFAITDEYVYKADFIKLRQVNLGYSIPRNVLARTPFQSANISLVARNLFLIYSAVDNVDPESNYNTSNGQGLENFGVPPTRSYGFNLSLKF